MVDVDVVKKDAGHDDEPESLTTMISTLYPSSPVLTVSKNPAYDRLYTPANDEKLLAYHAAEESSKGCESSRKRERDEPEEEVKEAVTDAGGSVADTLVFLQFPTWAEVEVYELSDLEPDVTYVVWRTRGAANEVFVWVGSEAGDEVDGRVALQAFLAQKLSPDAARTASTIVMTEENESDGFLALF